MRWLSFIVGIVCAALIITGECLPVRARIVSDGSSGFLIVDKIKTQNFGDRKVVPPLWAMATFFLAVAIPFLFLLEGPVFVRWAALVIAIAHGLALLGSLSGGWHPVALSWILIAVGDAGIFVMAMIAEKHYFTRFEERKFSFSSYDGPGSW